MNNKKILEVKKMNNFSMFHEREIESMVFYYQVCNETYIENEPFEPYLETKNEQYFETYQEAKNYFDTLEVDEDWCKRIDEFVVEDLELEFVEGSWDDHYDMVWVEEKEYEYTEDDFASLSLTDYGLNMLQIKRVVFLELINEAILESCISSQEFDNICTNKEILIYN